MASLSGLSTDSNSTTVTEFAGQEGRKILCSHCDTVIEISFSVPSYSEDSRITLCTPCYDDFVIELDTPYHSSGPSSAANTMSSEATDSSINDCSSVPSEVENSYYDMTFTEKDFAFMEKEARLVAEGLQKCLEEAADRNFAKRVQRNQKLGIATSDDERNSGKAVTLRTSQRKRKISHDEDE